MTDRDILQQKVEGDYNSESGFSDLRGVAKHVLRRKQIILYNWIAIEATNANTAEVFCWKANVACRIEKLEILANSNVTANNADYKTLTVAKRSAAGGAATTIVAINTAATAAGGTGNWTSFVGLDITGSNTTLNSLAAGEGITLTSAYTSAGVAIPINTRLVATILEL